MLLSVPQLFTHLWSSNEVMRLQMTNISTHLSLMTLFQIHPALKMESEGFPQTTCGEMLVCWPEICGLKCFKQLRDNGGEFNDSPFIQPTG